MYDEVVQMGSVHLITQAELPAVTARGSRIPISAEANTHPIILFEYLDFKHAEGIEYLKMSKYREDSQ